MISYFYLTLILMIIFITLYFGWYGRRQLIVDKRPVGNEIVDFLESSEKGLKFADEGWQWWPYNDYGYGVKGNLDYYCKKWLNNIPNIKKVFKRNMLKENKEFSEDAIFHFRCSDSPFDGDTAYTLLPREYYYFVTDKLNEAKIKKMYIITNMNHKKNKLAEKKCPEYLDIIVSWLQLGANFEIVRKPLLLNVRDSYRAYLGCKILFNNTSSFSFIPGVTKGKNFITASMLGDTPYKEEYKDLHKKVHWTMWDKFDHIPHSVDYETFDYRSKG